MLQNDLKLCHFIIPTLPQNRKAIRNDLSNFRGIKNSADSFIFNPSLKSEESLDILLDQIKSSILLYYNEYQFKDIEKLF